MGQRSEDRGQRSDIRGQWEEEGRPRLDIGRRKSVGRDIKKTVVVRLVGYGQVLEGLELGPASLVVELYQLIQHSLLVVAEAHGPHGCNTKESIKNQREERADRFHSLLQCHRQSSTTCLS